MLNNYTNKSNEPEYDFDFEVFIFFHRLERAGFKEVFEDFSKVVIDQYILRFGIGEHILQSDEIDIYHELEDPINFYINRYDEYLNLWMFMDKFEMSLTLDIFYSTLIYISENDN